MAKLITIDRLKTYWPIYLFVLPSVALISIFSYYPAASAMYHAFYPPWPVQKRCVHSGFR